MTEKSSHDDSVYFDYIKKLSLLDLTSQEIIYNFPSFVGSVNLARLFSFQEMFSLVQNISGDIADVGTYMGASMFSFAKLVKIFEPYSNTKVHGFDWFEGQKPGPQDDSKQLGKYITSMERIQQLIQWQGLDGIVEIHNLDLTSDLPEFIKMRPWLRFKIIFLDCGIINVMEQTLKNLWPLLTPGGILILDHYNNAISPQESNVVNKYCGNQVIRQINYSRSPTAYLIKETLSLG